MHPVRVAVCTASIGAIVLILQAVVMTHGLDDPLVVTGVTLVESEDAGNDFVKDTYRATLRHTGSAGSRDFAQIGAKVAAPFGLSIPGFVEIVDGDVSFGTVRAGESVESLDTFTIKRRQRSPVVVKHLRWDISGRSDLVLPDAWTGKWQFTITRTDPVTKQLESTSRITQTLSVREPVGFSLLPDVIRCRWRRSDETLDSTCEGSGLASMCLISGSARFTLARNGDEATGEGTVRVTREGLCGSGDATADDSFEISGMRLSRETESEPLSLGLLPAFAINPYFSVLLSEGIRKASSEEPTDDDQCRHGGWRRFWRTRFHDEAACGLFVRRHAHRLQKEGRS
jgi:hypothetical protein